MNSVVGAKAVSRLEEKKGFKSSSQACPVADRYLSNPMKLGSVGSAGPGCQNGDPSLIGLWSGGLGVWSPLCVRDCGVPTASVSPGFRPRARVPATGACLRSLGQPLAHHQILALQLSHGHVAGTAFCSSLAQPDEMHVLDLDSSSSALATLGSTVPKHNLLLSETTSDTPKPQLASVIGTPGEDTSLCLSDRVVGSTGHRGTSLEHHRRFVAALLHPVEFSLLCDANMAVRILVCTPEPETTDCVEGSAVAIAARNLADGDTPWQGHLARRAVGVTT